MNIVWQKYVVKPLFIFIFIHQTGSDINDNSNRKLNYKHLIKYYKLLQNWQKPFKPAEIYRNIKQLIPTLYSCSRIWLSVYREYLSEYDKRYLI